MKSYTSTLMKKIKKNDKFTCMHEIRKNLFNHEDDSNIISLVFSYGEDSHLLFNLIRKIPSIALLGKAMIC